MRPPRRPHERRARAEERNGNKHQAKIGPPFGAPRHAGILPRDQKSKPVQCGDTEMKHPQLGIDHHHQTCGVPANRDINHENPQRDANLRRRQAHTRRGIHRLDHVADEPIDVGSEGADRLGPIVNDAIAVFED